MEQNNKVEMREKLSNRLLEFAARILSLENMLCKTYSGKHIYGQLFRSGSSSGANFEESVGAESKADFIHKTQIVLKEIRESYYWLRLIKKTSMISNENSDLKYLLSENIELIRIFSSSLITAKQNKMNKS